MNFRDPHILSKNDWNFVVERVMANVNSEQAMNDFYNNPDNKVVQEEIEGIVNSIEKENATINNVSFIKSIMDMQTKIYKRYKADIQESIRSAKYLKKWLIDKEECSTFDLMFTVFVMLESEKMYSKGLVDEYRLFEQEKLTQTILNQLQEEHPEIDINDSQLLDDIKNQVNDILNTDPKYIKIFQDLQVDVDKREAIIKKFL